MKKELENLINKVKNEVSDTGWLTHSFYVADIAKAIANEMGLDGEFAYTAGLFHDIGRLTPQTCKSGTFHEVEGYKLLTEMGFPDIGRFCITHGALIKTDKISYLEDPNTDLSNDDKKLCIEFLKSIEYNDYDKIIQLADCMAVKEGYVILEQRILDLIRRRGNPSYWSNYFKDIYKLKKEIEEKINKSVYKVIPDFIDKAILFDYNGEI